MNLRAGALNSRVTIKSPTMTQDAAGQPIPSWDDVATVWANVRNLRGAESIKANAESSNVKASIRIRRRTGIDASMRVYHGETIYSIKAVLPDEEDRDKIDLVCEVINGEVL
jgi:SPP1 family predicted phage head-tail adaptor